MSTQIQIRRDTAANWTSNDPTLAIGEFGFETDTKNVKIGDGSTAWTSLPYYIQTATFTPTWTGITNLASTAGFYSRVNNVVAIEAHFSWGASTSISGGVYFTLPIASSGASPTPAPWSAMALDNTTAWRPLCCTGAVSTTASPQLHAILTNSTYAQGTGITNSIPFVWANGDSCWIGGTYLAA